MINQKPLFSKKEIPNPAKPVQTAQHFFMLALMMSMAFVFLTNKSIDALYVFILPFSVYHSWQVAKTGYALTNNDVYHRDQNAIAYWVNLFCSVAFTVLLAWLVLAEN
ncbi:hypothetical protein KO489_11985 [Reinekea forsetii]|nr:hypothetical protein [Reinekea forsetii]